MSKNCELCGTPLGKGHDEPVMCGDERRDVWIWSTGCITALLLGVLSLHTCNKSNQHEADVAKACLNSPKGDPSMCARMYARRPLVMP